MAGGGAEASVVVEAGKDKVEQGSAGQSVRATEQIERSQAPVDAAQSEVLGKPVLELVLALEEDQSAAGWRVRRRA